MLGALGVAMAACGGASPQAATPDRPASPGLWESQVLGEGPAEPESAPPPQGEFEPGQYYEDWPDVYDGARSGIDGAPWSTAPVEPASGPASQRPHEELLGK